MDVDKFYQATPAIRLSRKKAREYLHNIVPSVGRAPVKSTDTKLQTFLDLLAPKQNGSFPLLQDIEITFLLLLRCFQ